jgi:hypothetical protein
LLAVRVRHNHRPAPHCLRTRTIRKSATTPPSCSTGLRQWVPQIGLRAPSQGPERRVADSLGRGQGGVPGGVEFMGKVEIIPLRFRQHCHKLQPAACASECGSLRAPASSCC